MGFIVPPSKWESQHAVPIFTAQKFQAANGGRLPSTPMWRMLEFRHALNAARFNFYHPTVGRMIESQAGKPAGPPLPQVIVPGWKGTMRGPTPPPVVPPPIIPPPPLVPPPIVPPPPVTPPIPPTNPVNPPTNPVNPPPDGGGGTTTPPNPQEPGAPPVPEPSAVVLFALAILVAGAGFVRFRRRSIQTHRTLAVEGRRG